MLLGIRQSIGGVAGKKQGEQYTENDRFAPFELGRHLPVLGTAWTFLKFGIPY